LDKYNKILQNAGTYINILTKFLFFVVVPCIFGIYKVHTPKSASFIRLNKVLKFTLKSL